MFMNWFTSQFPYTDFHELNLDFLLDNYGQILGSVSQIDSWIETHEQEYQTLLGYYERLEAGDFTPEMIASMQKWSIENTELIISASVKMVFFGVTDDGHFIAYIPDSWQEISFGTSGYDDFPAGVEYGHLTLLY